MLILSELISMPNTNFNLAAIHLDRSPAFPTARSIKVLQVPQSFRRNYRYSSFLFISNRINVSPNVIWKCLVVQYYPVGKNDSNEKYERNKINLIFFPLLYFLISIKFHQWNAYYDWKFHKITTSCYEILFWNQFATFILSLENSYWFAVS